jgi:hypothetical protein
VNVAQLIETCLRGRLYADLAREAGGTPSAPRIRMLAKPDMEWKNFMDPSTLVPLADALGVSVRTLVLSNAESLGLDVSSEESTLLTLMPTGTNRLKQRHLDLLLPLIRHCIEDADREDRLAELAPGEEPKPAGKPRRGQR